MTISVNWATKVITVPLADLTLVSPGVYQLNVNTFRLALKDLEDSPEGMSFLDTHRHTAAVTLSGVTGPLTVEIINGYTVTFENGSYRVNLVGGNSNILDVLNLNQVQVAANNSFGLVTVASGSGLSADQDAKLTRLDKLARNKLVTNPSTGKLIVYDDDNVTPLLQGDLFEDVAGTQPYRGQGAERRDRLV